MEAFYTYFQIFLLKSLLLFQTTSINGAGKSRRNERAGRKTSSDRGEIYFKSESNASVSSFSVILIKRKLS